MNNAGLPPDSITTLPPEARLYAIRRRYDAMAYSGPTAQDRERDTVIGHLLDLIGQRAQPVTDPAFPDLVGVVGGPLIPCKVVEVAATTAPTTRVEGAGDLDATYEQTQRYVIRYQPKPIEVTYMAGVSDEEIERAKQAVLESATELLNEQQAAGLHAKLATVERQRDDWRRAWLADVAEDGEPPILQVVHVVRHEGPTSEVFAGPFVGDEAQAWIEANRTGHWTMCQVATLQRPPVIPERERLVHENPGLAAQIREGIAQAERGDTVDLGSFAQHLGEGDDDD